MRLRQVALAAEKLAPARAALFELLGVSADFKDPGVEEFGLENSVMAIGDTFLEIVAPTRGGTAAGRMLERRGVPACGYMVLLQVENFRLMEEQLGSQNVRQIWRADRAEVSACHIHPKDIGGTIVSVDEMRPPEEWVWGGPGWQSRQARHALSIAGCEISTPDPSGLLANWANVLGVPARGLTNQLTFKDGSYVRFVEGDTEGVDAVALKVRDADDMIRRARSLGLEGDEPAMGGLRFSFLQN